MAKSINDEILAAGRDFFHRAVDTFFNLGPDSVEEMMNGRGRGRRRVIRLDPYQVLGVKRTDPIERVRKVYLGLAKVFHTDNKETGDEQRMKEINEAWEEIKNDPN